MEYCVCMCVRMYIYLSLSLSLYIYIYIYVYLVEVNNGLSYLPTPPLGQDMTQGQFLSGV